MAIYTCTICGYVYDEEKEGVLFNELDDNWCCPLCTAPKDVFEGQANEQQTDNNTKEQGFERSFDDFEKDMSLIHEMAESGKAKVEAMRTQKEVPNFDQILLLGGQLAHAPLLDESDVDMTTIIGKKAKQPMVINHVAYVSHMSFGALSKEAKIALAKGTAAIHSAQCGGEGGILKEEKENAYQYIFEYIPNKYSVNDENLKSSSAIEIKIGQGTKPGMGGHLPADKVTEEIATIRNQPMGKDIHSPSRFSEITNKEDLKAMVDMLRERSAGRPIGIKIAAGHIEEDLAWINYANPDFITIDGRGGGSGASPKYLKDHMSVPTVYALSRARAYMDAHNMQQELIITGGFRTGGDIVKAIAMGADAVALATASMMALGCQQYRVCHNGNCPMGIATQSSELRDRLDVDKAAKKVANYYHALSEELKSFARVCGHENIHDFSLDDLITIDKNMSECTNIKYVGTKQ